ncbi:DUF4270 family protein [Zobellia galactanivorans]|uniref:DUF4270 family protein n=1 Tax=Zobellia galactanivorans (strain DSM 12802 / CCUG 47099 / CIP 106680 / NCIMB 13871 / Dsij) TaxID=63186 RepID=UPI0026E393D3|nr:DUF4270 family protein [Zobellia galactanivorans]MDO6807063.1 DUF4270 family protein [Zobellia galactanivorans]
MKNVLIIFICSFLLISCSTDALNQSDFEAGDAFTDSDIRVIQLDTMTVAFSTMKFDSIDTSQSSRMLVGKYKDPVFGAVKTASFMELIPSSYFIDTDAVYDSITFLLRPDDYYYNDTLQVNTIHIKQLNENLKPADGVNFYNTSSIGFDEDDLGFLTYTPRPLSTDTLEIKLTDTFGTTLFDNLQQKKITTYDEFKNYFYGISVQPGDSDDGSIIGFSLTSNMRLYYSIAGESERTQYSTDFTINTLSSPLPFFNQISTEEANEYLNALTDQEVNLYSSETENLSFIQSGIGIATRLEFPHIKSVFDIQGQGTLLDASLRITPEIGSYNDLLTLRDTLSVFIVDQNNELTDQLYSTDGTAAQAILNRDNEEFNDIYYELPLSGYLEDLLSTDLESSGALILLPSNYNSTVDRFVLNTDINTQGTTLELTYAIYDEDE